MFKKLLNFDEISIRTLIILSFIIIMFITAAIIGYIVFDGWLGLAESSIQEILDHINGEIENEIDNFINIPLHILDVNKEFLEEEVIDLNDQKQREKFFVTVLGNHSEDSVYSFSFGSSSGNYYGARRNLENEVEIMRNNEQSQGYSWYYEVKDNFEAGDRTVDAGYFDPRTRLWYQRAEESQQTGFSEVYKHFIMNDLTVSASTAIYSDNGDLRGVLGAHITLERINNLLEEISSGENTETVIIERDSEELIANSLEENNFDITENGTIQRNTIGSINNSVINKAYKHYLNSNENNFKFEFQNKKFYLSLNPFQKNGLDWLIITSIPASVFTAGIYKNMRFAAFSILLAILLSIGIYLYLTNKFLKPISELIEVTDKFAAGDLSKRAEVKRNDEIASLAVSFNKMADRINNLFNNLENKVAERTRELEETNKTLKENFKEISYISYHDSLTGLYNRKKFEAELKEKDRKENLPISIIFADLNGLKLTNDIFGHDAGDDLLIRAAEILKTECRTEGKRKKDIIARVGGDEFAILLSNTDERTAEMVLNRIKDEFEDEKIRAIKASIAVGFETKNNLSESLERTMDNAERKMYKNKTLNRKRTNNQLINTIIETIHERSPREKIHSKVVSQTAEKIGEKIGMSTRELRILREAGFIHDIGKVVLNKEQLNKLENLNEENDFVNFNKSEKRDIEEHPIIGYRILNLFDETVELADIILAHHENWDGSGYPRGLKGEEIPLMSRIIKIADNFDWKLRGESDEEKRKEALKNFRKNAGKNYDPILVDKFFETLDDNNQLN